MNHKINLELISLAKEKITNIQKKITLSYKIDKNLILTIKTSTKIEIKDYKHTVSNFEIRHALLKHSKDPLPLTEKDIGLIPDIIKNYDEIKLSKKTRTGLNAIMYIKHYNSFTYYIEEIRTGKRELAFKTMYKNKTPGTKDAL